MKTKDKIRLKALISFGVGLIWVETGAVQVYFATTPVERYTWGGVLVAWAVMSVMRAKQLRAVWRIPEWCWYLHAIQEMCDKRKAEQEGA